VIWVWHPISASRKWLPHCGSISSSACIPGYWYPHQNPECCAPRMGDIEVMQLFLQHGYWNLKELHSLNQCRLYLWAFWISNICNGLGNYILITSPGTPTLHIVSGWSWPKMAPSLTANWRVWQLALLSALHLSHTQCLATPLGPWLLLTTPLGWYFEWMTDCLWCTTPTYWKFFRPIPHHTCNQLPSHQNMVKRPLPGGSQKNYMS